MSEKPNSIELEHNTMATDENNSVEHHELKTHYSHVDNSLAFKGDDSDGKVAWTARSLIAAMSLGFLYVGSQIMLYFVGGSLSFMEAELHATAHASWLPVSNTLAITAVAPFTGYLQDLLGRREITLAGSIMIMVGQALVGSAHTFGQAVTGMALGGGGAGICELTALAGISDIVPVRHRGIALGLMTGVIIPFTPYVMYSQLLGTYHTWRWGQWICLIWNGITFIGLVTTYFPKAHPRMEGFNKKMILARIDYVGAFLSITGITLFLVALQAGGYTHSWRGAYVLCQLIIGIVLILSFVVWEWKFAKYPMIPGEMFRGQKIVALAFCVAFVAGVNFYSLINFFPLSFGTIWSPDPVQIGLKGLGYGISTTVGAVFFNALLSTKLEAKWVLLAAASMMTAFGGALAVSNPTNPKVAVALGTLASFGVGGVLVPSATVALIVVPDALLATTAALSLSIRTIGGSIGFTIYYNIFVNKLTTMLPESVAEYAIAAGLSAADATAFVTTFLTDPAAIESAPGYTPAIAKAATLGTSWAYAGALKYVWYVSIPFGVLAMISAAFVPNIKKYQTNRVAVAL
ncbi:putative major facilitator superfamily transporter [Exophiala viscosa]|uniref:Major facilitator superfamily transporter n=1 Tax=Exophiala viscosa TaxID=2486360 RepID=A0AAN6DUN5_9EURO|nr:putative major facilitator superfamily transporter [Exophiala viscosa]KAI1625598.1 putative major facilitator superfamily transporter [Exophiala viscosa]